MLKNTPDPANNNNNNNNNNSNIPSNDATVSIDIPKSNIKEIYNINQEEGLFPNEYETSFSDNDTLFAFKSSVDAQTCLDKIKKLISRDCPSIQDVKIISEDSAHRFRLTESQWKFLREPIRQNARSLKPANHYLFKSLRVDGYNYYRRFIEMIVPPFVKHPIRYPEGEKRKSTFTVKGDGVHDRSKRKPQYTEAEKKNVSKAQPTSLGLVAEPSLGLPDLSPAIFGHKSRSEKTVGVLFDIKDVLLSNWLYLYDGGTVTRPYDFFLQSEAEAYFNQRKGKILFSKDQFEEFKAALRNKENESKHNEVLARLSWNIDGSSKIFIGSDNLESRLMGQEYARILKAYMLANGLCQADYSIPICFYMPGSPSLHFREYTPAEQQIDFIEAKKNYSNLVNRHKKYAEQNYEFLLTLSSDEIEKVLQETFNKKSLLLLMLSQGYFHIVTSLLEKVDAGSFVTILKQQIQDELANMQTQNENQIPLVCDALYYSLIFRTGADELFMDELQNYKVQFHPERHPLVYAAEMGYVDIFKKLLSYNNFNFRFMPDILSRCLLGAAKNGHAGIVYELLSDYQFNLNSADNKGNTALHLAAKSGHVNIVSMLLQTSINAKLKNAHGQTAFNIAQHYNNIPANVFNTTNIQRYSDLNNAITKGDYDLVVELLKQLTSSNKQTYLNSHDYYSKLTPLQLASRCGHEKIVNLLLSNEGVDRNNKNELGHTALSYAVSGGFFSTVEVLLKENDQINNYLDISYYDLLEMAGNRNCKKEVAAFFEGLRPRYVGMTVLHLSILLGHTQIAYCLLSNGANDRLQMESSNMDDSFKIGAPLALAESMQQPHIANLLKIRIENANEARKAAVNAFHKVASQAKSDSELNQIIAIFYKLDEVAIKFLKIWDRNNQLATNPKEGKVLDELKKCIETAYDKYQTNPNDESKMTEVVKNLIQDVSKITEEPALNSMDNSRSIFAGTRNPQSELSKRIADVLREHADKGVSSVAKTPP